VAGGLGLDGQEHDNGLSAYGNSAGQSRLPPQQQDEGGLLGWLDEGDEEEGGGRLLKGSDGPGATEEPETEDDPSAAQVNDTGVQTDEPTDEGGEGGETANESLTTGGDGAPSGGGDESTGGEPIPMGSPVLHGLNPVTPPVVPQVQTPSLSPEQLQAFEAQFGMTVQASNARIQAAIDGLAQEVSAAQTALTVQAEGLATTVESDMSVRCAEVDTYISTASTQVGGAYDGLQTSLTTGTSAAHAAIAQHRLTGEANLAASADTEQARLDAEFTDARGAIETLKATEAPQMQTALLGYAAGLEPIATEAKGNAEAKGAEIVSANDPAAHDASSGLAAGKASLRADVTQNVAKETATNVATRIQAKLDSHAEGWVTSTPQVVSEAVEPYATTLETSLTEIQTTAGQAMEQGRQNGLDGLAEGETSARATVDAAHASGEEKIRLAKEAGISRFDAAGTTLRDAVGVSGEEFANTIAVRANQDTAFYAQLLEGIQLAISGEGPFTLEQVQPLIEEVRSQLEETHPENLLALQEIYDNGLVELDGSIADHVAIFDQAVAAEEAEAQRVAAELDSELMAGADQFGLNITGLNDHYSGVLDAQIAEVQAAKTTFNESATAGLAEKRESMRTVVESAFEQIKLEFQGWVDAIPGEVEQNVGPKVDEKLGKVRDGATKMRAAMDGWGTDEAAIFAELRGLGYGEIECIEAVYDDHYAHRANDGMRPLRYDLNDEFEDENNVTCAMAYLDHDRKTAIRLELEQSIGFWNDDEARIEAVLRTCSDDEVSFLNTDAEAVATLDRVRSNLGGCDLDTMNMLVNTEISKDLRLIQADAIRVFDGMDGAGTDEAAIRSLLENAKTPEQRAQLRAYFNTYAAEQGWEAEGNMDLLETALRDDFSATEAEWMVELSKTVRDQQAVGIAQMLHAGSGGGTNEKDVFEGLTDEEYTKKWDAASPEERARLEAERAAQLDAQVTRLSDDYESVEAFLDYEMGENYGISYEEARRGTKDDGSAVTAFDLSRMNLERAVADRTRQRGKAEPDLMIRWAVEGGGTDEDAIKKALGNTPKSRSEVRKICTDYKTIWKEDLRSHDELDVLDFDDFAAPGGRLASELSGCAWMDVRELLCGKPETPEQVRYVTEMRVDFETSGVIGGGLMVLGEAIGYTDTQSDLEAQQERFNEEYNKIPEDLRDDPLSTLGDMGSRISELSEYLIADAKAYGTALSSFVDAIITVIEIIGAVVASVVTAGTASPLLAAVIASLIVSSAGIALKAAALGDRYGAGDFAGDVAKALVAAATAGLGEVKALGNLAKNAGTGVLGTIAREAGEEGGMVLVGVGWELSEQAQKQIVNMVSAGVTNTVTDAASQTGQFLIDEKTYDMTLDGALFGETGLASKLAGSAPAAFVSGAASTGLSDAMGPSETKLGSALTQGTADATGNVLGYSADYTHYNDAGQFWTGMATSTGQSFVSGAAQGYADHTVRPRKDGRAVLDGDITPDQLANDFAHYSDTERQELVDFVLANGGTVDQIPAGWAPTRLHGEEPDPTGGIDVVEPAPDRVEEIADNERRPELVEEVDGPVVLEAPLEGGESAPVVDDNQAYQEQLLLMAMIDLEEAGYADAVAMAEKMSTEDAMAFVESVLKQARGDDGRVESTSGMPTTQSLRELNALPDTELKTLLDVDGLHDSLIDAIIEARKDGPFTSSEDLQKRVKGIGPVRADLVEAALSGRTELHNHQGGVYTVDDVLKALGHNTPEGMSPEQYFHNILSGLPLPASAMAALKTPPADAGPEWFDKQLATLMTAGVVPFDDCYTVRKALFGELASDPITNTRIMLEQLKSQGADYVELQGGMSKHVPPSVLAKMCEEVGIEVRFLSAIRSRQTLGPNEEGKDSEAQIKRAVDSMFKEENAGFVVGVDYLGEEQKFTPEGQELFVQSCHYMEEQLAAHDRDGGVMRVHVGEGYFAEADTKKDRDTKIQEAEHNVEYLIEAITKYRSESSGEADVQIRVGHVTHANEDQIRRLTALGVHIEVNIGSNLSTNAILDLDQHPLLAMLYHDAEISINTDAGGVMNTDLDKEYKHVADILELYKDGDMDLKIGDQEITYEELPADIKERFSLAYIEEQAKKHHRHERDNLGR